MTAIEKIQRGATRFVDMELMPKLAGRDKWIVAGVVTLYIKRLPALLEKAKSSEAVKLLGVIGEDNSVDIEAVYNSIKPAAAQTPAAINIPMGGTITITSSDIDTLYNYIMQA